MLSKIFALEISILCQMEKISPLAVLWLWKRDVGAACSSFVFIYEHQLNASLLIPASTVQFVYTGQAGQASGL